MAFLKNQTSILWLLRKLDHIQIKFKLSISVSILTYAVYILYTCIRTSTYAEFFFIFTFKNNSFKVVKVINIIFGVFEKRCVFVNDFIFYRFNIKWSIIFIHLRIATQIEKWAEKVRRRLVLETALRRLTISQSKLQTFKFLFPTSPFTLDDF